MERIYYDLQFLTKANNFWHFNQAIDYPGSNCIIAACHNISTDPGSVCDSPIASGPSESVHTTAGKRGLKRATKTRTGPKDSMYCNRNHPTSCYSDPDVSNAPVKASRPQRLRRR